MKRGLKDNQRSNTAFVCLVATYAPMKRGLKDYFHYVAFTVATYAPMKRGLKVFIFFADGSAVATYAPMKRGLKALNR